MKFNSNQKEHCILISLYTYYYINNFCLLNVLLNKDRSIRAAIRHYNHWENWICSWLKSVHHIFPWKIIDINCTEIKFRANRKFPRVWWHPIMLLYIHVSCQQCQLQLCLLESHSKIYGISTTHMYMHLKNGYVKL